MSPVHSQQPVDAVGHHGEFVAAEWAATNIGDVADIWFNLNWLGRVADIDQLVHLSSVGTFVIEVKGYNISQVLEHSPEITSFSDGSIKSPEAQARKAAQQLNSWLEGFEPFESPTSRPWFSSTVWWPQISRAEWNAKFSDPMVVANSRSMLFLEDMASAADFEARLLFSRNNPLRGQVPPKGANEPSKFDKLREILLSVKTASLPDEKKTASLLQPRPGAKKRAEEFPFDPAIAHKVVFSGYPGTGKTAALLEVARNHAVAGARVLYVSFNQTLAAEIRQEIRVRGSNDVIPWSVRAVDLHDLYELEAPLPKKSHSGAPYVEELKKQASAERVLYDTVLIDESQDLPDEAFEFLQMLTMPTGSWFLAFGDGQMLYQSQPSSYLERWRKNAQTKNYKASFRTSPGPVLISQAAFRFLDKSTSVAKKWLTQQITSDKQKSTPTPLDIFSEPQDDAASKKITLSPRDLNKHSEQVICSEIYSRIYGQVEDPDLLILVIGNKGKYAQIKAALDESGKPYIDYVEPKNRRVAPVGDSIRLCTYSSSRGITARDVLIFEFENLNKWQPKTDQPGTLRRNLANIALSRASRTTTIVYPEGTQERPIEFLEDITAYTEKLLLANY